MKKRDDHTFAVICYLCSQDLNPVGTISMKSYAIKEIYYTIQGEGMHTGRPAVFCRFAGCNLWSGREEDRDKAVCQFCDTDFFGTDGENGGKYLSEELIKKLLDLWPDTTKEHPYVVFTGGEPLLQLDATLITALHAANLEIAIETNGTIEAPESIDWICVSPKATAEVVQKRGNELKFVYPQKEVAPEEFINLDFDYFFIQPMDGPDLNQNIKLAIDFCLRNPQWRLSLQTHKFSGMK